MTGSGWPSASATRIVSAARRTAMRRASALARSSAERIPPRAETGFSIVLLTIFDQRSWARSSMGRLGHTWASASATRRALSPAGASCSPTYTPGRSAEAVARLTEPDACTRPGSRKEPFTRMTPPTTRSAPTSGAIHSSLMLFCIETTRPPSARCGLATDSASIVSYDFTQRKRRSTGPVSSAGAATSRAACSSASLRSSRTASPRSRMASRCGAHGSTTVGASPALARRTAICPPMAPAP